MMSQMARNHIDPDLSIISCVPQFMSLNFSEAEFLDLKNMNNKPDIRFAVIIKLNDGYRVSSKL